MEIELQRHRLEQRLQRPNRLCRAEETLHSLFLLRLGDVARELRPQSAYRELLIPPNRDRMDWNFPDRPVQILAGNIIAHPP